MQLVDPDLVAERSEARCLEFAHRRMDRIHRPTDGISSPARIDGLDLETKAERLGQSHRRLEGRWLPRLELVRDSPRDAGFAGQ